MDAIQLCSGARARIARLAAAWPSRKILVAGIEVPSRARDIHAVVERLISRARHDIDVSVVRMADKGKFENIDDAIAAAPQPLGYYDWLIVADDDIAFGPGMLDQLIALSEREELTIAQPAHAHRSYTTYRLTRRRANALVRRTAFVEIGPLTAIRRPAFAALVPFPASRWGYGIDVVWADLARRNGWRMGVIDATPVRHLRPVAASYDKAAALAEGAALLQRMGVACRREDILGPGEVVLSCLSGWRRTAAAAQGAARRPHPAT